jgi:hypothetical protein
MLKLAGLPQGSYEVKVDGNVAQSYSAGQLEKGIPIGTLGPAQQESGDLGKAVRDKEDVEFMRWRDVQLRFTKLKSATNAAQALNELANEANEVARLKAKPRKYEITISAAK